MTPLQQYSIMITSGVLLLIVFINQYMQGFFLRYAIVKASKGKKVIMKVRTKAGHYFTIGKVVDGNVSYKDRNKKEKLLTLGEGSLYRSLGINWLDTNEENDAVFNHHEWRAVPAHDANRVDSLIKTALMKPSLNSKQTLLIILLCVVAFICLAGAYFGYKNYALTQQVLARVTTTIATSQVTPA